MKQIIYTPTDFPTDFLAEQLANELISVHGQNFAISTLPSQRVTLTLNDTDNEAAIRATCLTHFAKTPQQRLDDLADAQAVAAMNNGDKNRKFFLEVFYQIDQRLRIVEARPAITKQVFVNGLKNIYKNA